VTIRRNVDEGDLDQKEDRRRLAISYRLRLDARGGTVFLQDDPETEIQPRDLQDPPAWMLCQFELQIDEANGIDYDFFAVCHGIMNSQHLRDAL
jgi:hypothetical protein